MLPFWFLVDASGVSISERSPWVLGHARRTEADPQPILEIDPFRFVLPHFGA